jgi:hypothetical protein
MDARGYWHTRPVVTAEIGQRVKVEKADGQSFAAVFAGVEKNRVTLRPEPETWPYLEFAEAVSLVIDGQAIRAQVWDNRGGTVILRTLPL